MRIPLLIAWGVAVVGIIFGSFFDFNISSAIANSRNTFGLLVSAIVPTIGFAGIAVLGGGFIAFALRGKYPTFLKVIFYVMAAGCLAVAIHFPAGEYFGVNGFHWIGVPEWVGYFIVIIPECAAMVGGYFLFKDFKNQNLWIVFLIAIAILGIALVPAVSGLKAIMHRPRFRYLVTTDEVSFHNWWEPFKEYDEYIAKVGIGFKDEFKSYPSGHTTEASILFVPVTFLPLAHEKFKKYQMPLFYASCGLVVLVAFARILAAAHFLSDVSTGATIMLTLTIIANEVVMRIKALQLDNQAQE